MHDSFTSALMAQFLAVQPEPEPQVKELPLPPEQIRQALPVPETENQCEAI